MQPLHCTRRLDPLSKGITHASLHTAMTVFAMSIIVLDWIIRITYLTLAISSALLLVRYKSLIPAYKWFLYCLLAQFTTTLTSEILYRNHINPNYGGSAYYIFAILLYIQFFRNVADPGRFKPAFYGLTLLHVAFAISNILFIQKETINTYSAISHSIIILSLCLL